jgi:hypothetical protein
MPRDLPPEGDELFAERFVAGAVSYVPLSGRDDLERAVALLVELDDVGEGLGVASISPDSCSSSTIRFLALNTVLPASSEYAALAASVTITSGASASTRPS